MTEALLQDDVTLTISRCAEALEDLDTLRAELMVLRLIPEPRAQFATALFDLERARRGDAEAREQVPRIADSLLVYWHKGSGLALAKLHPALEELWANATTLLATFEAKKFRAALRACWDARESAQDLSDAVELLEPAGNRRVEFARCLYHLALVRLGVQASRAEFARRVGLLSEAYQDHAVAEELVGTDEGLLHQWHEVRPYLDEFFETMEEAAAKRSRVKTDPAHGPGGGRPEVRTDPAIPVTQPPATALPRRVPGFRTLMGSKEALADATPPEPVPAAAPPDELPVEPEVLETAEAPPPPPPPSDATPPGGWKPAAPGASSPDLDIVEVEEAPPPPPPDLTPPGSWLPPKTASGEVELVDAEEVEPTVPPPPPTVTPAGGLPAAPGRPSVDVDIGDEPPPDEATQLFWTESIKALSLMPNPNEVRVAARALAIDTRADRKRLVEYLESLEPWFEVPDARAFGCLLKLMLAGALKEKSLFGQVSARRAEGFAEAFALLSGDARAAGHGAVWFAFDGPATAESLHRGLEVLMDFLGFCSRQGRDPLDASAQREFLGLA